MGLSYYARQKEEEKKKAESSKKVESKKPEEKGEEDNRSTFSKVTDALFGGTKKLAGTARAGVGGVYGLGKVAKASIFDSDEEYERELAGVEKTLDKDLGEGKAFLDAGEADHLSTGDLLKKSAGGGAKVASEVLPFMKGGQVATKGLKFYKAVPKVALEGTAMAGAGSAGGQLAEDGKVDLKTTLVDSLLGAGGGVAGYGAVKGLGGAFSKLKPGAKATPESSIGDFADEELDQFTPKKIEVSGGDEAATVGKVSTALPDAPAGTFTPAKNVEFNDVDFRLKFKDKADQLAKDDPKVAEEYLSTGSKDPVNLVMSKLAKATSKKAIMPIVKRLVPGMAKAEYNALAREISGSTDESSIKGLLYDASHNAEAKNAVGDTVVAPGKKITFEDASEALLGEKPQTSAARVESDTDRLAAIDEWMNSKPGAYRPDEKPSLHDVDTRATSPEDAKKVVAANVEPATQAKAALTGESDTPVAKAADDVFTKLDETVQEFDESLAAPAAVKKHLKGNTAVTRAPRKNKSLNRFEDTLSVLGRYLGKVGTDFGYKLAEGAKKRSDMYEYLRPSLQQVADSTKNIKSQSARKDVGARLNDALQDRDNLLNYAKTPEEKKLFQAVADIFNYFEVEMNKLGLPTMDNYSPRVRMKNMLEAPDRMMDELKIAIGDEKSRFTKRRTNPDVEEDLDTNILDILPTYVSSMTKDLSYRGAMDFLRGNMSKVHPSLLTNKATYRDGLGYVQKLMEDTLEMSPSKHKFQEKLISNTYSNQLKFNVKTAFQNMTQRFAAKSHVSKQADKMVRTGKFDQADLDTLYEGNAFTTNPITDEMVDPSNVGRARLERTKAIINKLDPFQATERGNVKFAFNRGAAQAVIESKPYKEAIRQGVPPKEAFKQAIQDPATKEAAIRRGNMLVNDTQFGANAVTKPEWFRDNKDFTPFLSDKWFKQYLRYPFGMTQHVSTILRANDARALDILKNGNPAETKLVDYLWSAESLLNGVDDIIKGIKSGEITDVKLEMAQGYRKSLENSIKTLHKEIRNHSQIRSGKTAKNVAKMWAAAAAIQFMFDAGFSMSEEDQIKEAWKSVRYSAPINTPTKNNNFYTGLIAPSSPIGANGVRPEKLTNFIPGVGLAVNRGREINRFVSALTGDNE